MESDLLKVHPVLIDALDIQTSLDTPVFRGVAESTGVHQSSDNLQSNTTQKFTYIVPSVESITDLELYWNVEQQLNATIPAASTNALDWGNAVALGPYGALQQVRSITLGLNGASINEDLTDNLNEMLKFYSSKYDYDFHSMCPNQVDEYVNDYQDAISAGNGNDVNVLGSFHHTNKRGRGAFPVDIQILAGAVTTVASGSGIDPNALVAVGANAARVIGIKYRMTVPIMCSPLKFREFVSSNYSVTGINKLEVTLQFSSPERVIRVGQFAGGAGALATSPILTNISLPTNTFAVSEIVFTSYKAFPDTQPKPMQVVPYMDMQCRTIQTGTQCTNSNDYKLVTTGVITMTSIPQYIMVTVGKPKSTLTSSDSDSYYTIQYANGQYCEKSILNTNNSQQLWLLSRKCGNKQTYEQWSGRMFLKGAAGMNGNGGATFGPGIVGTEGSTLILQPGLSFPLPVNLAPGSVYSSQFTLQLSVRPNYSASQWALKANTENPEIVITYLNPGFITSVNGVSSTTVGLLGSSDIADAIKQVQNGDKTFVNEHMSGSGMKKLNNKKTYSDVVSGSGPSYGGKSFGAKMRNPLL